MKETFGLYLILTDPVAGYEACAKAAVDCGVRYLQLRMKNASRQDLLDTAFLLRKITKGTQTRFIVNDDLDVAMEVDADGVHLGQDDLSLSAARSRWTVPGKIFGLSTHSMEQAIHAVEDRPDYIGVGPLFPTSTKPDADPALGIDEAGRIINTISVTAVAIGGINSTNLSRVLDKGIPNFCVVGAVNSANEPSKAIRSLQKIWKNHGFGLEPTQTSL